MMNVGIAAVEVAQRPRQSVPNPLEQYIAVAMVIEFRYCTRQAELERHIETGGGTDPAQVMH